MLTIYKNETTLHSITASVENEGRIKLSISNSYDFEYEQYTGVKKIILNKLLKNTLYRITASILTGDKWIDIDSVLERTADDSEYIIAHNPTGGLQNGY